MTRPMFYTYAESPVGTLFLASDGENLVGLYMNEYPSDGQIGENWEENAEAAPFPLVKTQLAEYFAGMRTAFGVPLAPEGTPFQKMVWAELLKIPYGATITYGELARRVGNANASRAVGLANGRNPISILIPCHRVIGASGKLTGYGGGLPRKQILLDLERGGTLF